MRVLINIDEEAYNGIYRAFDIANKYDCPKPTELAGKLMQAIYDGTPLPKGHGRLIDADTLIKNAYFYETILDLEDAPTIIEAESEVGE